MSVQKSARLRELLGRQQLIRVAGAHNGLSARLVEQSGFDAIWASGFELSTSYAVPDASILSMHEMLDSARVMNEAASLPVIADCDTGFGELANVIHMVRRYETAGIAGVCIEDKTFPKRNSFVTGRQELISTEIFCDKIHAAKSAQMSPDFVVIGRTEAFIVGLGADEALARASAYAEAGADAILVHSRAATPAEIWYFMEGWHRNVPVVIVPTTYRVACAELEKYGVRMVIYANVGIRAAARAMREALDELHMAGDISESLEHRIASVNELLELQGMSALIEARPWLQDRPR